MNLKIKYRESFRPFAPCVLRERAHEVFDIAESAESPYMLIVAPVREKYRRALTEEEAQAMKDPDLRKRVNVCRSDVPRRSRTSTTPPASRRSTRSATGGTTG